MTGLQPGLGSGEWGKRSKRRSGQTLTEAEMLCDYISVFQLDFQVLVMAKHSSYQTLLPALSYAAPFTRTTPGSEQWDLVENIT